MESSDMMAKRVLIVDDESSLRRLVRANLEIDGLEVIEAVDGVEAMEKLKHDRPDLILLDIMMPRQRRASRCSKTWPRTKT